MERIGTASLDILCDPEQSYGVEFLDGSAIDFAVPPGQVWQYEPGNVSVYPAGAWLGYQRSDDNVVRVVAPTRAGAELVISSVTVNTTADGNGCTARMGDQAPPPGGARVRLCRYTSDGWLAQAETLTNGAAAKAVEALDAAPPGPARRCLANVDLTTVEVTTPDAQGVVNLDSCLGMSWDGRQRDLTAEVLYWVLSPGWNGQVPEGITLGRLRQ